MRSHDAADRPTLIEHKNGSNVVKYSIAYVWNPDNTVDTRTETDYTPGSTQTHVTSFSYDHRKRLTAESRVLNTSTAVYRLEYECDRRDADAPQAVAARHGQACSGALH